jgi:hypothetical protein
VNCRPRDLVTLHLHCSAEEETAVSKRTIKRSNDVDESTKRVSVWAEVCDGTVRLSDGAASQPAEPSDCQTQTSDSFNAFEPAVYIKSYEVSVFIHNLN